MALSYLATTSDIHYSSLVSYHSDKIYSSHSLMKVKNDLVLTKVTTDPMFITFLIDLELINHSDINTCSNSSMQGRTISVCIEILFHGCVKNTLIHGGPAHGGIIAGSIFGSGITYAHGCLTYGGARLWERTMK